MPGAVRSKPSYAGAKAPEDLRRVRRRAQATESPFGVHAGPALQAPGMTAQSIVQLQRSRGNAAVTRMVEHRSAKPARHVQRTASALVVQREVVKVGGGEKLEIADGLSKDAKKALITEAKALIKEMKDTFGITISSETSVKAILKDYFPGQRAPKSIRDAIQPVPWKLDELKNVRAALRNYAPLLGKMRKKALDPTIAGSKQKITSIGKVGKALSPDDSQPHGVEIETDTLGESFSSSKNITFFEALSTGDKNFKGDNPAQQRGTTSHELCHAMVQPEHIGEFVSTFSDYWQDEDTRIAGRDRVSTAGPPAEAPISFYGGTNAGEDLAETAKFYFEAPDRLKGGDGAPKGTPGNPAPRRYDFFHRIVVSWTNSPEAAAKIHFQELAAEFLKSKSKALDQIMAAYKAVNEEYTKCSESDQKQMRFTKSAVGTKYAELVMESD
jgi:hypothetical protein